MSPEDMQRFEIQASEAAAYRGAELEIHCRNCPWYWMPDGDHATLAELVQRAGEHTEVCR